MDFKNRNKLIGSVATGLNLIEILSRTGGALSLTEIAKTSGQPKSSVHRMLATLVNLGYVEQDSSSRYHLTFKLVRLGMSLMSSMDIVTISRPHLEDLMRATNESAYLAVLDSFGQSVYLSKVETSRAVAVHAQLGAQNPAWCTTTGWAMLAFLPEKLEAVLARPLIPRSPMAISDPKQLRAALAEVTSRGCAVTRAQGNPEAGGIGAPIRDFTNTVVAACSISIPLYRMDDALVRKSMPLVVRAATEISMGLMSGGG